MAQVLAASGKYPAQPLARQRKKFATLLTAGLASIGILQAGALLAALFGFGPFYWASGVTVALLLIGTWQIARLPHPKRSEPGGPANQGPEQPRSSAPKGLAGHLKRLPAEFQVLHGVSTPDHHFDFVVVGPTGVFVIEARPWRGTVSADGTGELLCNGEEMEDQQIRCFMARVMETRRMLHAALGDMDTYLQAVLVFTAARVDVCQGATRTVHCLPDDQIADYIMQPRRGVSWLPEEIARITESFRSLQPVPRGF